MFWGFFEAQDGLVMFWAFLGPFSGGLKKHEKHVKHDFYARGAHPCRYRLTK